MKNSYMPRESSTEIYNKVKPYLAVIFLQFGHAGMGIIAKFGLNHGMSHYTFAVYGMSSPPSSLLLLLSSWKGLFSIPLWLSLFYEVWN